MSACPTRGEVDRWLAGDLDDAGEARVDAHLRDCSACLDILNEKTAVPEALREALVSGRETRESGSDPVLDRLCESSLSAVRTGGRNTDEREGALPAQGDPAPPSLPPNIPGYELLEEIGRGGLGVVFKARQVSLGRIVAVKMVRSRTFADPSELARFRLEAEAVAGLQHPNLVQVYDIIEQDGSPCLCMEYVPGVDLSKRLGGTPQAPESAARLVEILARAMHTVHEAGYLHRDLKPANILLADTDDADSGVWLRAEDGPPAALLPKITDFGLAKQLGADRGLTETHSALGTPSYMAPEQALAAEEATPAADVYSLGAILYEALVGRPPFRGSSVLETMAQVIHEEPVSPRRLVANIPVDLEAVCLKCLEKEPTRRYESAEALAEDLHRIHLGQQTIARPMTAAERLWRWCRRNRAMASLLAGFVLTLVAATTVTSVGLVRAKRAEEARSIEAKRATDSAKQAVSALEEARQINEFLTTDLLSAVAPAVRGRDVRMRELLDEAAKRIDREGASGGRFEDMPLVHASIRHTLGRTYRFLGEFQTALPHLEIALRIRAEELGEDHPEALATATETGLVLKNVGRLDDALALCLRTHEAKQRTLGPEHLLTLRSSLNAGHLYARLGRHTEAETVYVRLLKTPAYAPDGKPSPVRLGAMSSLANLYQNRGRGVEAEALLREVVEVCEESPGPDHPMTLSATKNLAVALFSQNQPKKARLLFESVLAREQRVLGPDHRNTLTTILNLGACNVDLKRFREAESLLTKALERNERQSGPDDPRTLLVVFNMANLFAAQSQWEKALPHYERASTGTLRLFPNGHASTSTYLGGYGDALRELGRYEEAETNFTLAYENARKVGNGYLAERLIGSLVEVYEAWGKPDLAATWRAKLRD